MELTKFGARLDSSLPITIDSMMAADRSALQNDEALPGKWYIAKPKGAYGPLRKRIYHAWLVLTNRAMAVQFMCDSVKLVKKPETYFYKKIGTEL